ncbi:MAG: DUF2793 domain-containing protein [Planctomycetota bacterium]|jgi:hypothetical protein
MTTPRLSLAELVEGQSSGHVTHNEALADLDAAVMCMVKDRDLSTPPGSPSAGDAYIVKATGTGDWSGHDREIAYYNGGWEFIAPKVGFFAYVEDEGEFVVYYSSTWNTLKTRLGLAALAYLATVGTSQIDDDAVTYAKIQNVSATDKILGRATAGSGIVEEIACTAAGRALLDDADAAAQRTTLGFSSPVLDKASPGAIGGTTPAAGSFDVLTSTSKTIRSVEAGITASTTQSQGQQPLTKDVNEVSTVANANDVVTLPGAEAGRELVLINNGANTLQVFPASGDAIDGGAADASITLGAGVKKHVVAVDGTDWYTV